MEELKLNRCELLKFSVELDKLGIRRYGHNPYYSNFVSEKIDTRKRTFYEMEHLLELSEFLRPLDVKMHLSENSNPINTVKEAVKLLFTLPEKRLKKIHTENIFTKVGSILNLLKIGNELPIKIPFDVGHFTKDDIRKISIYNRTKKTEKSMKLKTLFIRPSKVVKRVHKSLDIERSMNFLSSLDKTLMLICISILNQLIILMIVLN